jgi:hypothetical protein
LDPGLQPALAAYGVALEPSGGRRVSISGTPAQIEVR